MRKQLKRCDVLAFFAKLKPCVAAMEACGTAHYWAREIAKLGHEVRLVPPACVKAYVKRGKSDRIDTEAIREAASRPTMRFVPVKSMENRALATPHRARRTLQHQQPSTHDGRGAGQTVRMPTIHCKCSRHFS